MKPIFKKLPDQTALSTGLAIDDNGNFYKIPLELQTNFNGKLIKLPRRIPCENANIWGVICMTETEIKAQAAKAAGNSGADNKQLSKQQIQTQSNNMDTLSKAINPAKNVNGTMSLVRTETADGGKGTGQTLFISFDNTAVGAVDEQILLGDGSGVIAQVKSIPAIAPTLVINGDYKAATLAAYNNMIRAGRWIRLKGQVTFQALNNAGAAAPQLFGGSTVSMVQIQDPKGTTVSTQPFDFLNNYTGQQLDNSVRHVYEFDYTLADMTALLFAIPKNFVFSMSAQIYSNRNAVEMELV